ncbi:MAG: reverse transcriptase domain-containing protein [Pseudomonadota bacterium]
MVSRRKKKPRIEIYGLDRSPFAHRLTQLKFAQLIRMPLSELKGLIKYKSAFVTQKEQQSGGKTRPVCYPTGRLRLVNEKITYQLRKVRLPKYVMSPRRGIGQKQNAEFHASGRQILKLDLKQFYPSISRTMVARFFRDRLSMHPDVAGLLTELLTYEDRVFYGAPSTPVLAVLTHQELFDAINRACVAHGTEMSLWVDNFIISGDEVPGALLNEMRKIIAKHGHRSHDIKFEQTNRKVSITGIDVRDGVLHPPNKSDVAIRDLERELHITKDPDRYEMVANKLLSRLGGQMHILGSSSERGRKIAQRMNTIRQKRDKARRAVTLK